MFSLGPKIFTMVIRKNIDLIPKSQFLLGEVDDDFFDLVKHNEY